MKRTTAPKSPWETSLVTPWIEASGREGDFYRRTLINPILAYLLDQNAADFSSGVLQHAMCSLLRDAPAALYSFAVSEEYKKGQKTNWTPVFDPAAHTQLMSALPLKPHQPKAVLDLGCGTGYRGHWLGDRGYDYLGLDLSQRLVEYAKDNCVHGNAQYLHCNLDSPIACDLLTATYAPAKRRFPDWILAVTLFDHLKSQSIELLLETLTQIRGLSGYATVLAVTCNPQFYDAVPDTEKLVSALLESVDSGSSSPSSVEIYHRSRTAYSRMFRDAGITVLDQFTPRPLVNFRETSAHNKAVGPFCFWLLRIGGRVRTQISLNEAQQMLRDSCNGKSSDAAIALAKRLDERSTCYQLTVGAGEPIISAHNMGGRLFAVERGCAKFGAGSMLADSPLSRRPTEGASAQAPLDVDTSIQFGPSDVFGDLEIGGIGTEEVRSTFYRQTVLAATETTLLEISAATATGAFEHDQDSLSSAVLTLLRRRLQSQIWLTGARMIDVDARRCNEHPAAGSTGKYENWPVFGPDYGVSSKNLQHVHNVAAALLGAWDAQRTLLANAGAAVNTILLANLSRSVLMVGAVEREGPGEGLRVLCDAGVILAWPLKECGEFQEILSATLPAPIQSLVPSSREHAAADFKALRQVLKDRSTVHFVLIEDMLLLRRLAVTPDQRTFRLLASSARVERLRAHQASVRGSLPSFAQLSTRFGAKGGHRYATAIAKLLIARINAGLLDTDSLGQPLL